jgi:endonuclease YncB( thermonuclease family)
MKHITMIGIFFWSLVCFQACASIYEGKVVGVSDGDTLTVLISGRQTKVRLAEIDAPEKRQPFGERSKQSLSDLVYGKRVKEAVVALAEQGVEVQPSTRAPC